jgi:acyl-coenzyme A thioesterase PaaI-like protein
VRPTTEYHEEVLAQLKGCVQGLGYAVPPRAFEELQPRVLDYVPKKLLSCTFLAEERFANPMYQLFGAYLTMAFDVSFGMFAMLTAERPCATVTLDTHFIRPLPANGQPFTVQVRLRALNRSMVFLEGVAVNHEEKAVATATTTMNVVRIP